MELVRLAESYGAQQKIGDHIIEECIMLLRTRFAMLGIAELSEAFRMAAADELAELDFKIYYGKFNAKILGDVLRSYRNFRSKIVAELIRQQSRQAEQQSEQKLRDQKRIAFDREFPKMVEAAKANEKYSSWESIPVYWYTAAKRMGLISFEKGEAHAIYEEAKTIAIQQAIVKTKYQQKEHEISLAQLEKGIIDISHVQLIARKLSVWKKLLENEYNKTAAPKDKTA